MSGIREIVEQILDVHPQAIEHINNRGKNILHVAVKYRQIEIFNLVVNNEMLARRLVRKTDEWGNSILHMVGKKRSGYIAEKIQSPALQLQKELLLFERVKEVSKTYFIKHLNENKQTPEELFAKTYSDLHNSATDWLKRTSENCTIVAVLIATVAFAAAYTIPGGPNQSTGLPLLLSQPFFVIFTLTDVISLTFALTSVVTFLSILTSSFRLQDFKNSLPQKLMLGFTFLILSVSMMMVAFAATIVLMIRNKERWTKIVLYSVAFLPVTLFAISYSPLYLSLLEACKYPLKLILKACPRCNCFPLQPWINNKSFEDNSIRGDSSSIKPHKSHPNRTPLLIQRDTSSKATKARQNRSKPKTHTYSPSTPSSDEKGRRNASISLLSPGHEEKEGLTGRSQESSKSPFNESRGEGEVDGSPENDMTPIMRTGEIPLFLATWLGIQEIVKEIFAVHPQAFEHINCKGKNILHFAIKHRQIKIFILVVNNEFIARNLVRKLDDEGNSILHMVGKKRADYVPEKIQSPALQLQKELILFELT
uniref:PGG domain-containing protein n=1 Tax=Vitis vinifera TaxID=29760 RepID=F6GZA3_VITVI